MGKLHKHVVEKPLERSLKARLADETRHVGKTVAKDTRFPLLTCLHLIIMSTQPLPHPDHDQPPVPEPDTVATPEGDNELPPDVPLTQSSPTPTRPRGDHPHPDQPHYPALS